MLFRSICTAAFLAASVSPTWAADAPTRNPLIDYAGFAALTRSVDGVRAKRLVSLKTFQQMAEQDDVIILDARSVRAFKAGHIKGAVNLPFSEFTDQSLAAVIGDKARPILIYCNNNFSNNAEPVVTKRVQLALNIQTFINLSGYGYTNVFELNEVVDFNDANLGWVRATS